MYRHAVETTTGYVDSNNFCRKPTRENLLISSCLLQQWLYGWVLIKNQRSTASGSNYLLERYDLQLLLGRRQFMIDPFVVARRSSRICHVRFYSCRIVRHNAIYTISVYRNVTERFCRSPSSEFLDGSRL